MQAHPCLPVRPAPKPLLLPTRIILHETLSGVYMQGTKEGIKLYTQIKNTYRFWNPNNCLFAAAVAAGLKKTYIEPGNTVLNFGAGKGITSLHLADMIEENGSLYAIELPCLESRRLLSFSRVRYNFTAVITDYLASDEFVKTLPKADGVFAQCADFTHLVIILKYIEHILKDGGSFICVLKHQVDFSLKAAYTAFKRVKLFVDDEAQINGECHAFACIYEAPFEPY